MASNSRVPDPSSTRFGLDPMRRNRRTFGTSYRLHVAVFSRASFLGLCHGTQSSPDLWLARTCARHRPQKDWLSGLGIVFLLAKNDAGWKVETSRIVWLS